MNLDPIEAIILQGASGKIYYKIAWDGSTALSLSQKAGVMALAHAGVSYAPTPANPDALPVPAPVPVPDVAPPLTGIEWHQPDPVHPAAGAGFYVGWFIPIGGIGPYTFALASGDASKYRVYPGNGCGEIANPYTAFGTTSDVIVLSVTDARGVTVKSGPITIHKTDGSSYAITQNRRDVTHNGWADVINGGPILRPQIAGYTGTLSAQMVLNADGTPNKLWQQYYDDVRWRGTGRPPAGTHTMLWSWTDTTTKAVIQSRPYTLTVAEAPPVAQIEFNAELVSTSMLPGSYVGTVNANTATGVVLPTIADDQGVLQIDAKTRRVTICKTPGRVGPLAVNCTVGDGLQAKTATFVLDIKQGVTVDPSKMKFAQAPGLDNAKLRQHLGDVTLPGVVFAGTPRFAITEQTRLNPTAVTAANPARITINDKGSVDSFYMMSEGADTIKVVVTDGITTCVNSFDITVARCANVKSYYVGKGDPKTIGNGVPPSAIKLATWEDMRGLCMAEHPTAFYDIWLDDDADPEIYVNGNTRAGNYNLRFAFQGPGAITWVGKQAAGAPEPNAHAGGPSTNDRAGGGDMRGKGNLVMGHGDWTLTGLPIKYVHGSDSTHGMEAMRKDGETQGDLTVRGCVFAANDQGFETGMCHGKIWLDYCEFTQNGTSHVSSGACHNIYIGNCSEAKITNCKSRGATLGHLLKSRAMVTIVQDNELFDGLTGSSSCCADFPNGGEVLFERNKVEKGTMSMNPFAVQYAAEGALYAVNTFTANDNEVSLLTMAGSHAGLTAGFGIWSQNSPNGVPVTAAINRTKFYASDESLAQKGLWAVYPFPHTAVVDKSTVVTESGTINLSTPPLLDTTRPWFAGELPKLQPLFFHTLWGQDYYRNFEAVQQIPDREQIVLRKTDKTGAVLAVIYAHSDTRGQGINKFGPGTAASFTHDKVYYPNTFAADVWQPDSWVAITTDANGVATLTLATDATNLSVPDGVTYFQLRFTAPDGTPVDSRYPVKLVA